jgi:phage shock protein PspC (stress-responsive transcriptional regulator)
MTDTRNTQSAPPGRSLRRSRDERILAGVSGGLGQHLGINAWWIRWAFIFLAFAGGAGVLLYIVAWIFIPEPEQDETAVSHWLSTLDLTDSGTVIGVVLIGAATLIVATSVFDISGTLVTAAVLFAVGLLLYRGGLMPPPKQPRDGGAVPPVTAASDTTEESEVIDTHEPEAEEAESGVAGSTETAPSTTTGEGAASVATEAAKPPPAPRKQRERSMLGRLTLAIGLIVVSGMALLDVSGITVGSIGPGEWFDPVHYVIAGLFVVGGGLLVGAWIGRARWLIAVGLVLLPVLFVTALWPTSFDWSVGDTTYAPTAVADAETSYSLGAGAMTIDLTNLLAHEIASLGTIEVSIGVGQVEVWIPDDVGVELSAEVTVGEIVLPGPDAEGIGVDVVREFGPASPTVSIVIDAGAASVVVRQFERTSP